MNKKPYIHIALPISEEYFKRLKLLALNENTSVGKLVKTAVEAQLGAKLDQSKNFANTEHRV